MSSLNEDIRYLEKLEQNFTHWEGLCVKCGACCGLFDGDPCAHLFLSDDDTYQCKIYEQRFGIQKTVNNKDFKCVPIRDIIHNVWSGDQNCGYKKYLKSEVKH